MGLPAVDMSLQSERSGLRARTPGKKRATRKRNAARHEAARRIFQMSVIVMLCITVFALGRVMIAAQAAEASFESNRLEQEIKAERLESDLLEVDKSALTTPSRIEQIAAETLKMSEASNVSYMCLPGTTSEDAAQQQVSYVKGRADEEDALAALFTSVMEMSAGEAQVLLVGDVGLASSR